MRIVKFVFIIAVLGVIGYSLWTLRSPIRAAWQAIRKSPVAAPTVTFAVVGDNHGVNPVYRQIIKDLGTQKLSFLLNVADTSEYGRREEFVATRTLEKTLPFPVYHVLGSHDIKTDPTGQIFSDVFQQPVRHTVDTGNIHLITLNNADRKIGFPAADLVWLKKDLAAHPDTVNLIAYHRPFDLPFASLLGDDETAASRKTDEVFTSIVSPANTAYIFTAHLHTYLPYAVNGIPAVVTGGGGDPAQIVLGGSKNNLFHYLIVTVKGGKVTTEVRRITATDTTGE